MVALKLFLRWPFDSDGCCCLKNKLRKRGFPSRFAAVFVLPQGRSAASLPYSPWPINPSTFLTTNPSMFLLLSRSSPGQHKPLQMQSGALNLTWTSVFGFRLTLDLAWRAWCWKGWDAKGQGSREQDGKEGSAWQGWHCCAIAELI
jgi:hypothetical protein